MANLKHINSTHTASQVMKMKAVVFKQNLLAKISSNKKNNKSCIIAS
jgi:hypothetical protein